MLDECDRPALLGGGADMADYRKKRPAKQTGSLTGRWTRLRRQGASHNGGESGVDSTRADEPEFSRTG
jgi:hypothetical protein